MAERKLPPDFCDESLHYAAIRVNKDEWFPAVFPEGSLQYLLDLGRLLPPRDTFFHRTADEVITSAAINALPMSLRPKALRHPLVMEEKENAVAGLDFNRAAMLRDEQRDLERELKAQGVFQVLRVHIEAALRERGIEVQ